MTKNTFSLRNKKADSLVVSYVILIVIGLAISGFVYAYLKLYLPAQQRECEPDVKISIKNVTCLVNYQGDLALTIENRGLFNVSGMFIRFEKSDVLVKKLLNANQTFFKNSELSPGKEISFNFNNLSRYNITVQPEISYELEIEPATLQEGFLVPCKNSIVTHKVNCVNLP